MSDKLLTEHHLEFLSLKGGCRGSSESTLVKMSNWWKSHAADHLSSPRHSIKNTATYNGHNFHPLFAFIHFSTVQKSVFLNASKVKSCIAKQIHNSSSIL